MSPLWPSSIIPHPLLIPFSHFILTQLSPPTVDCCVGFEAQLPLVSCQPLAIHHDPIIVSHCCSFVLVPADAVVFVSIATVVVVIFVVVPNIGILQFSSIFVAMAIVVDAIHFLLAIVIIVHVVLITHQIVKKLVVVAVFVPLDHQLDELDKAKPLRHCP